MFDVLAIPDSCLRQDLCVAIDRSESSCLRQFRVNRGQLKAKSAAPRLRRRDREVVYLTGFIDGWQTADLDAAGSLVHQMMIVARGAISEIAWSIRISGLRTINGRVGDHAHEEHHYRCLTSSYAGQLHNFPESPVFCITSFSQGTRHSQRMRRGPSANRRPATCPESSRRPIGNLL